MMRAGPMRDPENGMAASTIPPPKAEISKSTPFPP
jgi:hypothetical protein